MRKKVIVLLMLMAAQAQAGWSCRVTPQDDIVITPQTVRIFNQTDDLRISSRGEVSLNGKVQPLDSRLRQQAIDYQASVRRDLPWIEQQGRQQLEKSRAALESIIVDNLGSDNNARQRLATLNQQLEQQIQRIIEHRGNQLIFHHQVIESVRQQSEQQIQSSLGGLLQDSINALGSRQMADGGGTLQNIISRFGGLQQTVRSGWQQQQQAFNALGKQVCQRIIDLDDKHNALMRALSQRP